MKTTYQKLRISLQCVLKVNHYLGKRLKIEKIIKTKMDLNLENLIRILKFLVIAPAALLYIYYVPPKHHSKTLLCVTEKLLRLCIIYIKQAAP